MADEQELAERAEIAERAQRLDDAVLRTFDELAALPIGSAVPHVTELLESFMSICGGADGLARLYVMQILAAEPGSAERGRCLDRLVKLVESVSKDGHSKKPLRLMDDIELQQELERREKVLTVESRTALIGEADDGQTV